MLGRMLLGLLVASAFVVSAAAQDDSQQPPQPNAAEHEGSPSDDQRGTEATPLVVKVLPPDNETEITKRDEQERNAKAQSDQKLVDFTQQLAESTEDLARFTKWLALGTGVLGLGTLGLLYFAGRQSRDMQQSIKLANRSIDLARDEFVSSHRPRLSVRLIDFQTLADGGNVRITFRVTNVGDTRARIVTSNGGLVVAPPHSKSTAVACPFQIGDEIAAGEARSSVIDTGMVYQAATWAPDWNNMDERMHVWGVIRYRDDRGIDRDVGYNRLWDRNTRSFRRRIMVHDEEYED